MGEKVSSTIVGCSGVSRHRWEEVSVSGPRVNGRELMRCRNEVRHNGEM